MSYKLADAASKTGLPRQARLLLEAICRQVHRPGQEWQVCHKELAERMGYKSAKTVQRCMPALVDKFISRRGIYRDKHYYSVIDPALWPVQPTAATVNLDKKSNVDKKSRQTGQDVQGITVLNTPFGISNEIPHPPHGGRAAEVNSFSLNLQPADADHPTASENATPAAAPGITLGKVIERYNLVCCAAPGQPKQPHHLRRCTEGTPKLLAKLNAVCRKDRKRRDLGWWDQLFRIATTNDLLNGTVGRRELAAGRGGNRTKPWQADLRWLLNVENVAKIKDGDYDAHQRDPDTCEVPPLQAEPFCLTPATTTTLIHTLSPGASRAVH